MVDTIVEENSKLVTDKLGAPIRQFDVLFTGNRHTSRIAIVIDENPTPSGHIRAVVWEQRWAGYWSDDFKLVREWQLSPSLVKDRGNTVHVAPEYWTQEIRRGVAEAKRKYGQDRPDGEHNGNN